MKRRMILVVLLALAAAVVVAGPAAAGTITVGLGGSESGYDYATIGGAVAAAAAGDTITVAAGTYEQNTELVVPDGVTLSPSPGVTVRFSKANPLIGVTVNGTLIAQGTETSPITFTSNEASPQAGDWNRINFGTSAQAGSVIDNCIIEYATVGINVAWTSLAEAKPCPASITNNTLRNISNRGVQIAGWNASSGIPRDYHPITDILITGNTFIAVGKGTSGDPMAIYTVSVKDVEISRNLIRGGEGTYLAYLGVAFENYTFANNIIENPGYNHGLYISTTTGAPILRGNIFRGTAKLGFRCIYASGHAGFTIDDNQFYSGSSGIYLLWFPYGGDQGTTGIIRGNVFDGVGTGDGDSFAIVESLVGPYPYNVLIENNVIRNTDGVGIWVCPGRGEPGSDTITGNTIANNTVGIRIGTPNYGVGDVTITAHNNSIVDNGIGAENIDTSGFVFDATSNWWGHEAGPSRDTVVAGDKVAGNVTFTPWISSCTLDPVHEDDVGFWPLAESIVLGAPGGTGVSTPAGEEVSQAFFHENGEHLATLTFEGVAESGTTTLTMLTPGEEGYPQPTGFRLGEPPLYFDITTDAQLSGDIVICVSYDPEHFPSGSTPQLFHYNEDEQEWENVTTKVDTDVHKVWGKVSKLSLFALGVQTTVTNVTSTNEDGAYKAGAIIDITVTFTEDVTVNTTVGTPTLCLNAGPAAKAFYASGSGTKTLTFTYTVAAGENSADLDYDSSAALELNGGSIKDADGNDAILTLPEPGAPGSLGANKDIVIDTISPTVTVAKATGQADPTNASRIFFTVTFSETVTGFTGDDVRVDTGTGTAFSAADKPAVTVVDSGRTYTVKVTGMDRHGRVAIEIPAEAVHDTAGNGNTASEKVSVTYDITAPSVTINQATGQADPTGSSPIYFTAVFREPVTGFTSADVTLSGTAGATAATVTAVTGAGITPGTTYSVAVSGMTKDGTVIASIKSGAAQDAAGNASRASTSTDNVVTYDTTPPAVTINQASGQADPTGSSPISFTAIFSEPVTGFDSTDVTLSGTAGATTATVTEVSGSGITPGTTYSVAVSGMTGDGTVIASIPAGAAQDAAGNASLASTSTDNVVTYQTRDLWTDIKNSEWITWYGVSAAQIAGVAQGYPDGSFRPDQPITRAQFAKMVVDGYDLPLASPATPTFSDVGSANYYFSWIEGAVAAGIISGYEDHTFRPETEITREQTNSILGRYLSQKELEASGHIQGARATYTSVATWYAAEGQAVLAPFADKGRISSVHAPYTAYLIYQEVVLGTVQNGTRYLEPLSDISRAQAAVLVVRTSEMTF